MLVAHPRKEQGELSKYDIAGSGDISNRVDYVYSIERFDEDDIADDPALCNEDDGVITLLKDRPTGKSGQSVIFRYDDISRRIYTTNKTQLERAYGWEDEKEDENESNEEEDLAPF